MGRESARWVAGFRLRPSDTLEAIEKDVALPVITLSLFTRIRSRVDQDARGSFAVRLLAALGNEFGVTQ
jgi:6-phosphogluconate dehydrogenase (decarboxylating)